MSSLLIIRDVAPEYCHLCVKKDSQGNPEKIWGVYCTFYRWDWDENRKYLNIDDAFIFSGPVTGPFRYTFGQCVNRLTAYRRRKIQKENYERLSHEDFADNPVYDKVRELVSKKMFWKILRT